MEAASPRRHPDFLGDRMPIDNDLAVIGKLDFQHATSAQFEIQIGLARLQRSLDPGQHLVGQAVEILVIHRATIPLFADSVPNMSRIAALLIILGLAACGMRGPLERPTGPAPEPLFGNPKPAPSTKALPAKTGPDVSTGIPTAKP